jgi:hypothetical protein
MRSMVEGYKAPSPIIRRANLRVRANYPSTTLRVVPLPIACGDREDELARYASASG